MRLQLGERWWRRAGYLDSLGPTMSAMPRPVRLLLATVVGTASGLFLAIPGWLAPTFAILVFVLACFLLRCASIWATVIFASVVASSPALAFAFGLSSHAPIVEALRQSFAGFVSYPYLVLVFLIVPSMVGGLLHFLLYRALSRHVQASA